MNKDRRDFLKTTMTLTALSYGRVLGANERIQVGGIGTGGRCSKLLGLVNQLGGAEIVAVCDVYEPRRLMAKQKLAPRARDYLDYRELLDRKDIDAVVIGSPDHWHVPMTIDAIQAGKDIYVEKPISHTSEEGDRIGRIAVSSKQVIQVGYQQRSWDHFKAARDVVASGRLGRITLILASWYQDYLKLLGAVEPVDVEKLDWKRFCGSAPAQPFSALRFSKWRWFWDFGGGHLTDLYSHYCDVIHWFMGVDSPHAVQTMGGCNILPQFECPDTISAAYDYPGGFNVIYNGTLVGSLEGGSAVFRGSRAMMKISRDGFAVYAEGVVPFEKTGYPEPEIAMRSPADGVIDHVKNFLECVRSRKTPNADVKSAVAAARAAHLGNSSFRNGARITVDLGG